MRRLREKLTYANVMSTIAVFLVLGGATTWAAQRVGTNQIQAGAVKAGKIADGAVTGKKIRDNAITGAKVNEATLGQVPDARNAVNATTLAGVAASAFSRQAHSAIDSGAYKGPEPFGGDPTVRTVQITAPQDGFLLMIGSASVYGNEVTKAFTFCHLNLDGEDVHGTRRSAFTGPEVPASSCSTNAIEAVEKGAHTVNLNFGVVPGGGGVEGASLDVVFVPFEG